MPLAHLGPFVVLQGEDIYRFRLLEAQHHHRTSPVSHLQAEGSVINLRAIFENVTS
jgi:hypothetical protein